MVAFAQCFGIMAEGGAYQVAPLTVAALEAALAQAGEKPPLVIPRAMGEVVD